MTIKSQNLPSRDQLTTVLKENVISVVFTKADGTERHMYCTTQLSAIPVQHHPKTAKAPAVDNIIVWDTDAQGWRSFNYNRLKQVSIDQDSTDESARTVETVE